MQQGASLNAEVARRNNCTSRHPLGTTLRGVHSSGGFPLQAMESSLLRLRSLNQLKIARLLETLTTAVEAVASIDESLAALQLGPVGLDSVQPETLSIIQRQRAALEADIRAIRTQLRVLGAAPLEEGAT